MPNRFTLAHVLSLFRAIRFMKKKLIIIGAGFAGLHVARQLKNSDYEVILIDQHNFHEFQPLFYQVATAALEPSAISFPLRKIFQHYKGMHVRITKVKEIDIARNVVTTADGHLSFDYLVIATGCTTNFFGNKNIEQYAYPMKSVNEAIDLRNRILLSFEEAMAAPEDQLDELMNIAVAGGGPTGVELAGALAEMKRNILPKDYPDMDFSRLTIYLIEGLGHTLQTMIPISQKVSQRYLEELGVKLLLNTMVQDYDGRTIILKDGRTIKTRTMIWTAGVKGSLPSGVPDAAIVKGNRIKVDGYNRVGGFDNIFAIGDIAYMENKDYPKGHPQLANVAINQAKNLAANMKRLKDGKAIRKFEYKNPGTMATVGKHKALVDLPFMSFQGWPAWLTWMFLHLMLILSVRNKLFIFINWAISYFTDDTTLRLILLPTPKQVARSKKEEK